MKKLGVVAIIAVFMAILWYSLASHKKSQETQTQIDQQAKFHAKKILEYMENLGKIVVISIPSGKMNMLSHSIDKDAVNVFVTHHSEDGKFVPRISVRKYDAETSIKMDDDNSDGVCERGTLSQNNVVKKKFVTSYDGRVSGKKHKKFFQKEYLEALKLITKKL